MRKHDANQSQALREAAAGAPALPGLWLTCLTPFALELAGTGNARWLGVDLQHGDLDAADLPGLLRVTDLPLLARSESHDAAHLGRLLDNGAAGVIVPGVESAAQAAAVVRAAKVPPRGTRSTGITRSALTDPIDPLVLPMVETAAGLAEVDGIVATEGVDGVFIGPYDLALSMGASSVTDPEVVAAIGRIIEVASGAGLLTGIFTGSADLLAAVPPVGLLATDSDIGVLKAGLREVFGG